MLKFSYSFDIKNIDDRYKELFSFNLYQKSKYTLMLLIHYRVI